MVGTSNLGSWNGRWYYTGCRWPIRDGSWLFIHRATPFLLLPISRSLTNVRWHVLKKCLKCLPKLPKELWFSPFVVYDRPHPSIVTKPRHHPFSFLCLNISNKNTPFTCPPKVSPVNPLIFGLILYVIQPGWWPYTRDTALVRIP